MRGAGDAEALCPRLYNAGLDGDLLAALAALALPHAHPRRRRLLAGREPRAPRPGARWRSPPRGSGRRGRGVAAPGSRRLRGRARPAREPLYQSYFVRNLKAAYRRRQRLRPDLYEAGRERGLRTIREYDDVITAPYGGYASAEEYYAASSAGPRLGALTRPALVLAALDDPMVPGDSVARWPLPRPASSAGDAPTGGHVGFVGARTRRRAASGRRSARWPS